MNRLEETARTKNDDKIYIDYLLKKENGEKLAYINIILDDLKKPYELFINYISTNANHRGKGYALEIMQKVLQLYPSVQVISGDSIRDAFDFWKHLNAEFEDDVDSEEFLDEFRTREDEDKYVGFYIERKCLLNDSEGYEARDNR